MGRPPLQQLCGSAIVRIAVALIAFCCAALSTAAPAVTATIDRAIVQQGETVTLSLAFEGNVPQPQLPAIPGFQLVGTGSQFSLDATRGLARQTFTFQLRPTQVGDLTIPPLSLRIGNDTVTTQPFRVKVIQPGAAAAVPGAAAPSAFVKLVTPKPQLYVGEVSEAEIHVYFQEGRLTQFPQFPTDPGLTVGKWLKPIETRATVSNQLYNVVIFKQPIVPVKAGALTLGPATVSLLVPDRNQRPNFFFGRAERELRMATEKVVLQAQPLPADNVPPTFAGAVGQYELQVAASPTNVAAGDPITLRVQIAGRGALDSLQLPPQPGWNEFKTYPPTAQIEAADENHHAGAKRFEQVVIPERAGIAMLPPFEFTFFDPVREQYQTLAGPPVPLTVAPGAGGSAALPSLPGTTNAAPAQAAPELAHIKPFIGVAAPPRLLLTQPWFLALQTIPPALWLGLLFARKRRERLANDPRLRRRAETQARVRRGLAELREHARAGDAEATYATALHLLQEQIGERVDTPPNAITESVVEERLRPLGAPEELCVAASALFQQCNLARYAPVKTTEELTAIVPKVEHVLGQLQRWEPRHS